MWKIVLLAFILIVPVMSQEPSETELDRRFDAAVLRVDPAWREEASQSRSPSSVRYSLSAWVRGGERLSVFRYPHDTEEQAAQTARELAEGSSVGFRPVNGYGDEAYLIDSRSSLQIRIIVRKGTTVLSIGSADGSVVLRVATEFVRELEQAQRDGIVR